MNWNIRGIAFQVVQECIDNFENSRHYGLWELFEQIGADEIRRICLPLETGRGFTQREELTAVAHHMCAEMDRAVEDAANGAMMHIQEKLQITTGDFAGVHYCGHEFKVLLMPLYRYMLAEMKRKEKGE